MYFFICTNNKEKGITQANHNPEFDIDKDVLWEGAAAYCTIKLEYLTQIKVDNMEYAKLLLICCAMRLLMNGYNFINKNFLKPCTWRN